MADLTAWHKKIEGISTLLKSKSNISSTKEIKCQRRSEWDLTGLEKSFKSFNFKINPK